MLRKSNQILIRLIAMIWLIGVLSQAALGQAIYDNFNASTPNTSLWSLYQSGGPAVSQGHGRVTVSLPKTSAGDVFYAGYSSIPWIVGDYDIQVDYALPVWPFASGVRVGLSAVATDGSEDLAVERISFGDNDFEGFGYPTDAYLAHYPPDNPQGITATNDSAGTLRLTRTGDITAAYFWNATLGQWVYIHSAQAYAGPIRFGLSAWSHDYCFTKQRVIVNFDNFRVNSGNVILPITPVGLEAPFGKLVPEGSTPEYPAQAFKRGQNLPLQLRQLFGGKTMTSPQVTAPKVISLSRDGRSVDISTLNLDAKTPNSHNVYFSTDSKWWVYCLRTKQLKSGIYVITLEMSDGRRYDAGFELK